MMVKYACVARALLPATLSAKDAPWGNENCSWK
jgi:hypothetical protein